MSRGGARLEVTLGAGWRLYAVRVPAGMRMLGTVTRGGVDTGALATVEANGRYVQINAGVVRRLDQRMVAAMVNPGSDPSSMTTHGGARLGAGRPPMPPALKKIPVGYRLPAWLVAWMRAQPTSQAALIEDALREFYGIGPPTESK